jgi:hypothetical protein
MWLRDFCGTLALQAQTSGRLCNGRPASELLKISDLRSAKLDAHTRLSGSLELRTRWFRPNFPRNSLLTACTESRVTQILLSRTQKITWSLGSRPDLRVEGPEIGSRSAGWLQLCSPDERTHQSLVAGRRKDSPVSLAVPWPRGHLCASL